jgi:ribosome maturation factor RimP
MGTSERIAELVEPILLDRGHELYDVELTGATVRVLVDRQGGVALDDLEQVSREISAVLDDADPMPDQFYLEVSSPGLERPLRKADHFRGAIGSKVKVKTHPSVEGERRVDGTLVAADDDGFTVDTETGPRTLGYDDVERARTVFEWGGQPKPGSSKSTNSKSTNSKSTNKKRSAS